MLPMKFIPIRCYNRLVGGITNAAQPGLLGGITNAAQPGRLGFKRPGRVRQLADLTASYESLRSFLRNSGGFFIRLFLLFVNLGFNRFLLFLC
jgi:hypothetical protein